MRARGTPPVWGHARGGAPNPFAQRRAAKPRQIPLTTSGDPGGDLGAHLGSGVPGHAPGPPPPGRLLPGLTCPLPQREGCPVAEDGGHRHPDAHPGAPRCRAVHPLPQGFPPPLPSVQLQVGYGGHRGGTGTARLSPPALLAGSARARCATRAPWMWASRAAAACFATSKGTHRLHEMGPQPSHDVQDTPRPGCLPSDLPGTQASGACRQVLLPNISGLRRVFLVAGPRRGKQLAPATPVAPVSSISCRWIDPQAGCGVGAWQYGGVQALLGGAVPIRGVLAAARLSHPVCPILQWGGSSRQGGRLLANSPGFLPGCEEPLGQEVSQTQR